MSTCRSCGGLIAWLETAGGKRIPVDEDPVPDGNIIIVGTMAHVLTAAERANVDAAGELYFTPRYVSHFATCPEATEWRKR